MTTCLANNSIVTEVLTTAGYSSHTSQRTNSIKKIYLKKSRYRKLKIQRNYEYLHCICPVKFYNHSRNGILTKALNGGMKTVHSVHSRREMVEGSERQPKHSYHKSILHESLLISYHCYNEVETTFALSI